MYTPACSGTVDFHFSLNRVAKYHFEISYPVVGIKVHVQLGRRIQRRHHLDPCI